MAKSIAPVPSLVLVALTALAAACRSTPQDPDGLRAENERLRAELEALREAVDESGTDALRTIPSFTVGLAASEKEFDASAFEALLDESLRSASRDAEPAVAHESDERQVGKVRGMLVEQYMAAEQLPIVVTGLQFELSDPSHAFKIGGRVVPREELEISARGASGQVTARHPGPLGAVMTREADGGYTIPFEELEGASGSVRVEPEVVEQLRTSSGPRAARHGDTSFQWELNLAKVAVYRVEDFQGDVGLFLTNMRFAGAGSSIGQYQTLRDLVFLFGYGSYRTSVVNQIRTPAHITAVEVVPIDEARFERLTGPLEEDEVLAIVGDGARWTQCEFRDFAGEERIWERPASVPFPFVSRQTAGDAEQVFYLKYGSDGSFLIGEYDR